MSLEQVTFEKSDYEYPDLEVVAVKIANFLYTHKSKLKDFSEFMRVSGSCNMDNYKSFVQRWSSGYVGRQKKAAPDTIKLAELASEFFNVCKSNDDIKKIRGLVPEKLFERIFEERHNGVECNIGYGSKVIVAGSAVIYIASDVKETPDDSDKNRRTVDAGFWDGENGEFVEIKFSPEAFHTKDINYLRLLSDRLATNQLNYSIYLVCLDHKNNTKRKLERLGLWQGENEFILIGRDEIFLLKEVV